ncbi:MULTISPECIES: hypothetical protein [unclassified Streptomyces]
MVATKRTFFAACSGHRAHARGLTPVRRVTEVVTALRPGAAGFI